MWMYYETDGDAGYYGIRLFSKKEYAEAYKERLHDAYGNITEINVDEGVITGKVNPPVQDLKCPECEGPMASRKGQYGTFWGCRKYPNCRGTRNEMGLSKEEARVARENERKGENDATLGDMQSDSSTILQDSHYRFKKN